MGAIFLSYAREDRPCAAKLAQVLGRAGHDVWWDRRLDGGEEFSAEIEAALDKSDVVLVAWSQESIRSRWVRDEASYGCDKHILVPVSIDGSQPPMGFRQFHTLDLTGWKAAKRDERTSELLRSVERRLLGNGKPAPTASVETRGPRLLLLRGKRRLWAAAMIFMLILAIGAALLFKNEFSASDKPLKPTIALLPLTAPSPESELRQLASQTRDSIAHTFSQSGVPLRLLSRAPQEGQPAVDFLISGDVSRKGDKILATLRLDEAAHGVTVFSRQYEAARDELLELPERIGAQMAGSLTWSFPMMLMDRRRPLDPALMAELLQGETGGGSLQAYQIAKRAVAKSPDYVATQVAMAFSTAFALSELPNEERAAAVSEARRAAERALELQPGYGDTYGNWCLLHSETRRAECEDRLRAGRRKDPDAPFLNTFLSHVLRDVGRFDESMDLAKLAHTHDVYFPTKIAWMLKTHETAGEVDEARDLYRQGARWWPDFKPMYFRNRLYGLVAIGDFQGMVRLEREVAATKVLPDYQESRPLAAAVKSKSIAAARRACPKTDNYYLNVRCMIALAIVGDQDGAYAIADQLYVRRLGRTPAETEQIWLKEPESPGPEFITSPAAAAMRRDPRFVQLADRIGLLAYWRSGRPPDFCRERPEPICRQLLKRI